MICPECHTPNPDQAENCAQCRCSLSDPGPGVRLAGADATSTATMAGPSTLKEWTEGQARVSRSISLVLPEGLEIGHRYRIVRLLGVGGMGSVYRVHDHELDRDVALKLIRAEIAENASTIERFKREIQLSSKVTHRNVLRVYDLGQADGIRFLTMQFVDGEDLSHVLKREGKLPIPRLLKIFSQICEGLGAAHEQGVIHRDLKPQNVMLDAAENVFVMDFGMAKSLEQSAMTQAGAVVGTPYYMSPEQVKGMATDRRSDIFSLGVILYEMTTGVLPYTGQTPYEVMVQRTLKAPKPPEQINSEIPSYLRRVIERCLSIDPALRYSTTGEILQDINDATFRPTMQYRIRRRRWLLPAAGSAALALLLGVSAWWALRQRQAAVSAQAHKAESVLIADFQNKTGDAVFDGTLEPSLGLALEGAPFLTSYNRGQARKIAGQLKPGATALNEPLARLVALREGIQIVTSGTIERKGSGYTVSIRALDAATGKEIVSQEETASGKDQVLATIGRLAASVRAALGDTTPKSLQLAAAETFTAGSVEAAHEYGLAQQLQYGGNFGEAIQHYLKATELDPDMGRADAGIAVLYFNQGRRDEAEKYYQLAMARIDRMSDREKFRTRGGYFLIVRRDPEKAIEEYSQLVARYPADTAGISNLALAYFYKRNMAKALEEGRRAIEIYPRNVPQKNNVGLYAMYAGEFETAIREQNEVIGLNPKFDLAYVGLALSQLAQGHPDLAAETYRKLSAIDSRGASVAASGLADIALTEGRPADAIAILEKGIETDLQGKDPDSAAVKLTALAAARMELGQIVQALAAADRAVSLSKDVHVVYPAGRIYIEANKQPKAIELAGMLSKSLEPDPQSYAELLRAEVELRRASPREAIKILTNAKKTADTWMGRYLLGRAYFDAQSFPDADTELEAASKRRGETTALFLDESPTYRLFPPVDYWLGRAREGIKSPAAAESYKAFLSIKEKAGEDPLVADARRRVGASK